MYYRAYDRARSKRASRYGADRTITKNWLQRKYPNQEGRKRIRQVNNAVRVGDTKKPRLCQVCGRSAAQAHGGASRLWRHR